ncbi:MAG: flavodoxin [Phascolarctobacterium sp.]|nr:flavodoxin [Phascolarctobacterium sp.]
MKKILLYVIIALLVGGGIFYFTHKNFVLGRVGMTFTNKPVAAETTDSVGNVTKDGKRVLVAYYSWGGNTRRLALAIHKKVGGDIVEIRPANQYPEGYKGTVKAAKLELDSGKLPEIKVTKLNMSDYDTILLGYPIWYYREPLLIESFLRQIDTNGKTILIFATSGGSPVDPSIATVSKAAPKAKIGDAILANDSSLIEPWLKKNGLMK